MPSMPGLEWTFDTAASKYEKMRPGYPAELYRALFDYTSIGKHSRVVEVGSGSGQATAPMLQTGCSLTAVECGEQFCRLLQEKFGHCSGFSVIAGKFEDVTFEENTYDLVFSATAFHWVPEQAGYEKAYAMLKKGEMFARFANNPYTAKENPALFAEIQAAYDTYYYPFHRKTRKPLNEFTEERARERALIAGKYGFTDLQYRLFHRERVFTAEEYIELLGTYSDHIAMDEPIRAKFYSAIESAIQRHGGTITIHDTLDLELARK